MALKTFNIDEKTYKQYSEHCKKSGISMSKQVEKFIQQEIEKIKGKTSHSNSSSNSSSNSNSKVEHQQAAHETSPANSHEHSFAKYC